MNDDYSSKPLRGAAGSDDKLRGALIDSRQRWRDLVTMAADLAFETDAFGRFVFVAPDPVLGWPAATLIGQTADLLLVGSNLASSFNPFRVTTQVRRRRCWLKQANGSAVMMAFAAAPLFDPDGHIVGVRGMGVDWTDYDDNNGRIAAALRRGEVLDHILWRMGQEVMAPRMMSSALDALMNAMGTEGAAVIDVRTQAEGGILMHQAGGGAEQVLAAATALLLVQNDTASTHGAEGRPILVAACHTRFGVHAGLALWRSPGSRDWDPEERLLAGSAAGIVRMVLEHESIQQEMARQARTDPLTGLLNRRAFLEEMARNIERLDREDQPGTLMFCDLDSFKPVNDHLGHEVGDEVLVCLANLLRATVRPTDLVARLGGDEFAVWLNGADHMTAAERAERLRVKAPEDLRAIVGDATETPTVSIGIACRRAGGNEPIDNLLRRADLAMYEVKRSGRGHWRVSQEEAEWP